jgi:hypothetical protein
LNNWDLENDLYDRGAFEEIIMETGYYDDRGLIWMEIQNLANMERPFPERTMEAVIRLFASFSNQPEPLVKLLNGLAEFHGKIDRIHLKYLIEELLCPEDFVKVGISVNLDTPGFEEIRDTGGLENIEKIEYISVSYQRIIEETDNAIMIQFSDELKIWVPKSVIKNHKIAKYFLKEKQLEDFIIHEDN